MQPDPGRDPAYSRPYPTAEDPRRSSRRRFSTAGWLAMIVFALLAAIGALGAAGLVGGYFAIASDLKPVTELEDFALAQESIVYDRTGATELARFGEFQREIVTFEDLPPVLVDATTAVEDGTFWTNTGFDPRAIIAAGLDALRGNARGASTITQQLVRQRLLDSDLVQERGRTAERKLKEIIQSIRLTKFYPGEEGKQQIITAYLNQNFYGNNSYGVKAAAKGYFGVELQDLTLAQAAILAALPQSPSSHDLVRNAVEQGDRLVVPPDTEIVQRRNQVLELMASGRTPLMDEAGETPSTAEFERAMREPVELVPQVSEPWLAPHFVWAVRNELTTLLCPEAETCKEVEEGGFRITTTIDLELQAIAEKWVKASALVPKAEDPEAAAKALGFEGLERWMSRLVDKDLNNGALVALDYPTGELVAYVGSADYNAETGTPKFQPKFDVIGDGWRQPGSAFKPFNYLTGIDDRKLTAASMFMDVGTDFGGGYTPNDADLLERGPVRVRSALQFSLNIPSVKATAVNRPEYLFARSIDYGMRFRNETPLAGLALGLGVQEVRPIDFVTAYGTLGNLGRYVPHTTLISVVDPRGEEKVPARPEGEQVASPEAASIVLDILGGNTDKNVNPFWGIFAITSPEGRRPAALKTGTNNDAIDLNAYGLIGPPTPEGRQAGEYALAVGVWNGNSDNTPVGPVFSIEVSTFVWQGFLNEATAAWAINPLPSVGGLTTVEVDPWTGLLPAAGQPSVPELFIPGTEPTTRVGSTGGLCGERLLEASPWETQFENWLAANRDWIARARRGPGVRGGPDRTRTSYFFNNGFNPYGRSWGPLLGGAGCETPAPSPSCYPVPTPDESGIVPSFEIPTPAASGVPAAEPCPTPSASPVESPSPTPPDTPPPIDTPPPPPIDTPPPPPIDTPPPPPIDTPPPVDTPPPIPPSAPPAAPGASTAVP